MKGNIAIKSGVAFTGSHVIRLFVNKYPEYKIINLDKLRYAGSLANLKDIEDKLNYKFTKIDVCDFGAFYQLMRDENFYAIINLVAESNVDRSIKDSFTFARTNVMGILSLLQAAKLYWKQFNYAMPVISTEDEAVMEKSIPYRFYHISTDEVYGVLSTNHTEGIELPFKTVAFLENHKAYGDDVFYEDYFVRVYHNTYGMPTIETKCSSNYCPYQFPEKLFPLFINNIRNRKPLPVYGKDENVCDWLHVEDYARATDIIFHKGSINETYNIGGFNEWKNIDLMKVMSKTVGKILGNPEGHSLDLITYVTDRLGNDARYAIDSTKLQKELGWEPILQFEEDIEKTVRWYLDNQEWMHNITSGKYEKYYEAMYKVR